MKHRSTNPNSIPTLVICGLITSALIALLLFGEFSQAQNASAPKGNACADAAVDNVKGKPTETDSEKTEKKKSLSKATGKRIANTESNVLNLNSGRTLLTQLTAPASQNRPIFLLLPGNTRPLDIRDSGIVALASRGFGVVTMSFSQTVASFAFAPRKGPTHQNLVERPTAEDLVTEIDEVTAFAREKFPENKTIIPVSLSYSGILSPIIKGQNLIIETVPMTSALAGNPYGESVLRFFDMMTSPFFPFSKTFVQAQLDSATRMAVKPLVTHAFENTGIKPTAEQFSDATEGAFNLAKIAEGREWKIANDPMYTETRRVFILAENETGSLYRHQLSIFKQLSALREDTLLILVKGASHYIPLETPEAYALAMHLAVSPKYRGKGGVITVEENSSTETVLSPEEARKFLGP